MQTMREELKAKARAVFATADRDLEAGSLTEEAWYQQVCGAQAAAISFGKNMAVYEEVLELLHAA